MSTAATPSSGGVFISYRRQETAPYARLLREELGRRVTAKQVFMDVDSIEIGVDFAEAIQQAVDACQVLLALVGPQWLTITDADGQRRLDDPDDTVRLEIEAALARNIRVIPVLVDNTPMPQPRQLPDSLVPLARRNALELTYNRYTYDLGRLLEAVEKVMGRGGLRLVRSVADQAFTAAQALADEERAWVLTRVAKGLAQAGDLDQATVVAEQALTTANQIRKDFERNYSLGQVANVLAQAGDLDQALRIANTIPDSSSRAKALAEVAEVLAQANRNDEPSWVW